MPKDYIVELVDQLGRALEAIIALRKRNPAKALDDIDAAFSTTKFKSKAFFDALSNDELRAFIWENDVDYRALDTLIDFLLEEVDIRLDIAAAANNDQLLSKIDALIGYTFERERELKIFSLKRNPQRERLKFLAEKWKKK